MSSMLFFPRFVWNVVVRLFLKYYVRLSIYGHAELPVHQNYIIVANHCSHLDALCLMAAMPLLKVNRTYTVAAKDYFFNRTWCAWLMQVFFNAIPLDRFADPFESLADCASVLREKESALIFFPEGTRSKTGKMQKFKIGIGMLTAGKNVLVIPAYIEGAFQAWPKGKWFPSASPVSINFGKPVSFADVPRSKSGFDSIAKALEKSVLNQIPKRKSDEYPNLQISQMVLAHNWAYELRRQLVFSRRANFWKNRRLCLSPSTTRPVFDWETDR